MIDPTQKKLLPHTKPTHKTANGTWYVEVPLAWLADKIELLYSVEYRAFYKLAEHLEQFGLPYKDKGSFGSFKYIQNARDRIECLTEAFPYHPSFPALLESAIELEAKATLLNAATGGR